MIRLDRIELLHWDIQAHQTLPLAEGVTMLTGENGSGKTSILDAIKVGLGARQLRGGRSVEDYLLKRAAPIAMIRLVVDNRSGADRRRPFAPLGRFGEDVVTLAVVFEATRQGAYQRFYYMMSGDRVPARVSHEFVTGSEDGRLEGPADYRDRLERVGIGREYRQLLGQPQGQIASLCRHDGTELFQRIYDIIGGQQVLEEWKERVRETEEKRRKYEESAERLEGAHRELELLRERAERHREYRGVSRRLQALEKWLPRLELREAQAAVAEVNQRIDELEQERSGLGENIATHTDEVDRLKNQQRVLEDSLDELEDGETDLRQRRDELRDDLADAKSERDDLVTLKTRAEAIAPLDLDTLERERETIDADLAEGNRAYRERKQTLIELDEKLDRIKDGILPYPEDVEAFQRVLRKSDVPHHLLAEVVEVEDETWTPAIEGFLGRYRFAVLVTDMASWRRAAELAREYDYRYGVLAPDYRGRSPYDEQGLFPRLSVKEDDYAQLVARLVRHVYPQETSAPLEPTERRDRVLAEDGFLMTRIEARSTGAEDHYLGRRARERRRARIEAQITNLQENNARWEDEADRLRHKRGTVEDEIERQKVRLRWEEARDRLSGLQTRVAKLEGRAERLDDQLEHLRERREETHAELRTLEGTITSARDKRDQATDRRNEVDEQLEKFTGERTNAQARLGEKQAAEPAEITVEERELVENVTSAEAARALIGQLRTQVANIPEDVRDPLVVENHKRQRESVAKVKNRLERDQQALEETRRTAEQARDQYHRTTRRVFRSYFSRLNQAAKGIGFSVDGRLETKHDDDFHCVVRVSIGGKPPVHHDSEDLSGGEKAALSILMGMTAVSLNSEGAGFFLIDEPFHHSDMHKINELGEFLGRTDAQYLVSMPTSADLEQCGDWLDGVWVCTKASTGWGDGQAPIAPRLKLSFAPDAR